MIKLYQALEFDRLLQLTLPYAMFEESRQIITSTKPTKEYDSVLEQLTLSEQLIQSNFLRGLSFKSIYSLEADKKTLLISNSTLSLPGLINIKNIAGNASAVKQYCLTHKTQLPLSLGTLISSFYEFKNLNVHFHKVLDQENTIRDQASENLASIRHEINTLNQAIYKQFKREVDSNRKAGFLAEGEESVHGGRYVLRVFTEAKRKVKGIIVGESDGGKTTFIEPQACVELNNQLIALELDELREIQKILTELTESCRSVLPELERSYDQLIDLDVRMAKARLSEKLGGVRPHLSKHPVIHVHQGFHPLLKLKLAEQGASPVPLNLKLDNEHRILIISGPNAGGKTIVLKSLGLFLLMLKTGYLIPVHPSSEFYLFHFLQVDIGDNQSLENDLSTYSAKLVFMEQLLRLANQNTFILIDEFGSGTEPLIGGAIAEAVLEELNHKKAYGIITTHYSNIKGLAHNTGGIVNGSMLFNTSLKKPMFELVQGVPGSSYALEMAERLKLPTKIIQRAKSKVNKGVVNLEELINNLRREKSILEEKNAELQSKISSLTKLIKAYDQLQKQNDIKRLKLKLATKHTEQQTLVKKQDKMDQAMKQIEEKLDILAARKLKEELATELNQSSNEIAEIESKLHELNGTTKDAGKVKPGDEVLLYKNNIQGIVGKVVNGKAEIITDKFTILTALEDVVPLPKKNEIQRKIRSDVEFIQRASTVKGILDIRGTTPMEASKALEEYLDLAIVSNLKEARILHGKGSGSLRRNILSAIKKNKFIKAYRHPEEQDGGLGVTIIEFA